MKNFGIFGASLSLFVIIASGFIWWADQYEESAAVHIIAPRSAGNGLAIYAQFIATQSLKLKQESQILQLTVPTLFPAAGHFLTIDLTKQGRLLERWRYQPPAALIGRIHDATLPITPPRNLEGKLEISFSALAVSHEQQEEAPQVLVESDDRGYPDGNYRVAANQKRGDISLALIQRQRRIDRIISEWQDQPLKQLSEFSKLGLVVLLIVAIPPLLLRLGRGKEIDE